MPFDGIVTKCMVTELEKLLIGTRIDKIQMPERDEIVLLIRTFEGNMRLSISSNPGCPGIYINKIKKENPQKPGMFCMLLRKHIGGGIIQRIEFYDYERVIGLVVEKRNEMGDLEEKTLIVEIMGKYSNIMLLNSKKTILDSIRHIDFSISSIREIMPARPYEMPPTQNKTSIDNISLDNLQLSQPDISLPKVLLSIFKGFSPLLINEILFRAGIDENSYYEKLSSKQQDSLKTILYEMIEDLKNDKFDSGIIYDINDNSKPIDFHSVKMTHQPLVTYMKSILDTVGTFYSDKDRYIRLKQRKTDLLKTINTRVKTVQKKITIHTKNLAKNEDFEKYKIYGDLILANLYDLKDGISSCTVVNFFSENQESIEIKMEPSRSPLSNSQIFYKKYSKGKSTCENTKIQLDLAIKEMQYLESVLLSLELSLENSEIKEIMDELIKQDIIKKKTKSKFKEQFEESKPHKFISTDGDIIMVGKNNKQNDYLTMRFASPKDIWLHVKDNPGSHVIVKKAGKEVSEKSIFEAASLAAYYSKVRNSTATSVDYTEVKHVKKIPGSKPGMVIYHEYKTINVKPDKIL